MPTIQASEEEGVANLAYFFIALPESLAIPQGTVVTFASFDFEQDADEPPTVRLDELARTSASLAFHQINSRVHTGYALAAARVAARAFLWQDLEFEPIGNEDSDIGSFRQTVVEAMIPISQACDDEIPGALDRAILAIERYQSSYAAVSQHAVPALALSNMQPFIPYAIRVVRLGEETTWPQPGDLRIIPNVQSKELRAERSLLTFEQEEAIALVHSWGSDGPFVRLGDVRRELTIAQQAGSTLPCAILCGASAEMLLRETLLTMLWEEGECLENVTNIVRDTTIRTLVSTQFHNRLGGSWSLEGSGVIASWFTNVNLLRNRAIHVGYRPSRSEWELAMQTYERLEHFVGDRLAASIQSFPLSVQLFLGSSGLARRSASKRLDRRLNDGSPYPADPASVFARWRREVERCALNGPWTGDPASAAVSLVIYCNGTEAWWLVDHKSGLACRAAEPTLSQAQVQSLARVRSDLSEAGLPNQDSGHLSWQFEGSSAPIESPPTWIPSSHVLPLLATSRFPESLVPPSL